MFGAMSCFAFARARPSFRAMTVPCSMPASMRCSSTLDASFCESGTTLVTKSTRGIARA